MAQYKKTGRIILLFLLFILTGCDLSPGGKRLSKSDTCVSYETTQSAGDAADDQKKMIWVHVCGEVKNPGVYQLEEGSRVIDGVLAAGGFTKNADEESMNLAELLSDAGKIRIYSKEEAKAERKIPQQSGNSDSRVNLNQATLEELMSLPGIGEKRARAILTLREQKGGFQKIEDLLEAEGIKEGIFHKIKDLIKI